jgi:hypothetical protein
MKMKELSLNAKKKRNSNRGKSQNTVSLREITAKTHSLQLFQSRGSRATKSRDCN